MEELRDLHTSTLIEVDGPNRIVEIDEKPDRAHSASRQFSKTLEEQCLAPQFVARRERRSDEVDRNRPDHILAASAVSGGEPVLPFARLDMPTHLTLTLVLPEK